MLSRVGALLALAVLCLVALPGAAGAAPCVLAICPTPSQTPTPTHTASPTPSSTATSRPSPTRTRSYSPRPRATHTVVRTTPSPTPVTTALPSTDGPSSSITPVTTKPADKATSKGGGVDKLVALILGAAVLLGVGGVSGLYLTRERDER